ncbi:MAG TPA: hypothetical protein VF059_02910 [Casimicrobiaceae bacterium]
MSEPIAPRGLAKPSLRRLVPLAFALVVAACASLALRDPPRIDVVGVRLDRVVGADAWFSIDVTLTNQVDEEIVVNALQGTLAIEGENIADASLVSAPVRLPAKGSASAEMSAHTGMDAVLRLAAAAIRRGAANAQPGARPTLRYTIEGSATLAGGVRVPFRRSGELGERGS